MNRIQERALRIFYKDYDSTFAKLLEKDSSVSIHIRNQQVVTSEIFKGRNNLSPPIVQNIFFRTLELAYSLRRDSFWKPQNRDPTIRYWIFNIPRPKLWSQVPREIKCASIAAFKYKIKSWRSKLCPCKLCKTYVVNLGYL